MDLGLIAITMIFLSTPLTCLLAITPHNKEKELDTLYLVERIFLLFLCSSAYVASICYIEKQYGGPDYAEEILIGFSLLFLVLNCGFVFIRDLLSSSKVLLSAKLLLVYVLFGFAMLVSLVPLAKAVAANISLEGYIISFAFYAALDAATIVLYVSYKMLMKLFDKESTKRPLVSLLSGFLVVVSVGAILFCGYKSLDCLSGPTITYYDKADTSINYNDDFIYANK